MNDPLTVLVAEDEETDFTLLERALRRASASVDVQWVRNGIEAIQYLKGEGRYADRMRYPFPHMLVLDLKMPEATGLDVLRWLQDDDRYRVIPTVVMSSSQQPRDVQEAYQFGANTYFEKPGSFQELTDLCRYIALYWGHSIKPKVDS